MNKKLIIIVGSNYFLMTSYIAIFLFTSNNLELTVFLKRYLVLMAAFNCCMVLIFKIMKEFTSKQLETGQDVESGGTIDFKIEHDEEEIKNILCDSVKVKEEPEIENSFDEINLEDINKIN